MKLITKAYLALAVVSLLWGTTYLAARIGVREIPGLFMAGIRQFLSGALLVSFFLARGYKVPNIATLKKLAIQGILLLCISNGLVTWSVEYITSGLAAIIAGLVPLFMALFNIILLKTARFTPWIVAGLALGFAGILTIFSEYIDQLLNPAFAFGIGLSLVAALSWSYGSVYSSRFKISMEFLFSVGIQMLIAGIVLLTISFLSGKYVHPNSISLDSSLALGYLVVFGSLVAYSAYVYAIQHLPPTLVSVYAYINPIVAISLGFVFLNERITLNVTTGTVITLAGVYLVNRDFKNQQLNPTEAGTLKFKTLIPRLKKMAGI